MTDGSTLLFGLPGVEVERVERLADGTRVVHAMTAEEAAAACPSCGVVYTSVRGCRTQRSSHEPSVIPRMCCRDGSRACLTPAGISASSDLSAAVEYGAVSPVCAPGLKLDFRSEPFTC